MLESLFAQSPIEASLWTHFVALQQWIVGAFFSGLIFKAAVATYLGFVLIRCLWSMGVDQSPAQAFRQFLIALVISFVGLALLSAKSTAAFRPVTATGKQWSASTKARQAGSYTGLEATANGLWFYVLAHGAANDVSRRLSEHIARSFGDHGYSKSPYLLAQTMAQTAGAAIDDPAITTSLQTLFESCTDMRVAPVLSKDSSFSSLFDLQREPCKQEYDLMRRNLSTWAEGKAGTSYIDSASLAVNSLGVSLGLADKETYRNKLIASALVNYVRHRSGQRGQQAVNPSALLQPGQAHPMDGLGQSYFTNLAQSLSVGGALNQFLKPITGTDYRKADIRNEAALVYSKLVEFLPPIRGYAKGILAFLFVFASVAVCFGNVRLMISWLGMLVIFTAYEPLSTLLYQSTMMFTSAHENVQAMQALKNDPLVLAGAAIVDDNLAGIQAVYFVLQVGLTFICGWAGLKVFMANRVLQGNGNAGTILAKVRALVPTK